MTAGDPSSDANADWPITPVRAPVVPRGRLDGGEPLPVEELVTTLLRENVRGIVPLVGPAGSGKTTVLRHLAAAFAGDPRVRFADFAQVEPTADALTILTVTPAYALSRSAARIDLEPWSTDDVLEYLRAAHPDHCTTIMPRVLADPDRAILSGSPQLWVIVLDAMSVDPTLLGCRDALYRHLGTAVPDDQLAAFSLVPNDPDDTRRFALIRHQVVWRLVAARAVAARLGAGEGDRALASHVPRGVCQEIARLVASDRAAMIDLHNLADGHASPAQPMAASILLAVDPAWRPPHNRVNLSGAHLQHAAWAGIDLCNADVSGANLSGADLSGAKLDGADLQNALLRHANLHAASLWKCSASGADFSVAGLRGARFDGSVLNGATFEGADLHGAAFRGAALHSTGFREARLVAADLTGAFLHATAFAGTDLSNAVFAGGGLHGVDLRTARLDGCVFRDARLAACNLEGVSAVSVDFFNADLTDSLFTGSTLPAANFACARLLNTGLADVDWDGANLANADLTGASFHLGSSRSGLVGSAVPMEGSMTGFYTDDYNDQDFKSPEEIRKANLCHCDLRGARVTGTDFYLVDLRGAAYTPDQKSHFSHCGALLRHRCDD